MIRHTQQLAYIASERGDPVVIRSDITWAVNAYGECTVFCMRCRKLFAEDVSQSEAREIIAETQCDCPENKEAE